MVDFNQSEGSFGSQEAAQDQMNHEIRADDNEEVKQDEGDQLGSNEARDASNLSSSQSLRVPQP